MTVKELIDQLVALGAEAMYSDVYVGSADMSGIAEVAHVYEQEAVPEDVYGRVIIEAAS